MVQRPPIRNLPPDAEPWGRWVDGQVLTSEAENERAFQSIGNSLTSIDGTLAQLGDQVSTIARQQNFLSSATIYSSLPTNPNPWFYSVSPPSSTNVSPAFDPQYDSELTFTAPTTGNYLINMSSNQVLNISVNTGWGAVTSRIWFEVMIVNPGTTQLWEGLTFAITSGTAQYGGEIYLSLPVSRAFSFPFNVGVEYRIRTRRNVITSHSSSGGVLSASLFTTPFSVTRANL